MHRRTFLSWISGALGACAATLARLPLLGFLLAPLRLKHKGGAIDLPLADLPTDAFRQVTYRYTDTESYVPVERAVSMWVRRAGDDVIAFSAVCTHLACNVGWNSAKREFICPCHAGVFAEDGAVKSGPPPRPLHRFQTEVRGDTVTIVVPEQLIG